MMQLKQKKNKNNLGSDDSNYQFLGAALECINLIVLPADRYLR